VVKRYFWLLLVSLIGLVDERRGTVPCGSGTRLFSYCYARRYHLSHHRGQQQTPSKQGIAKVEFGSWFDNNQPPQSRHWFQVTG